ncbi:MAG: hypothetical protein Q9216_003449 [Gyalolechia sp. 2 TL-2023]
MGSRAYDSYRPLKSPHPSKHDYKIDNYQKHDRSHPSGDKNNDLHRGSDTVQPSPEGVAIKAGGAHTTLNGTEMITPNIRSVRERNPENTNGILSAKEIDTQSTYVRQDIPKGSSFLNPILAQESLLSISYILTRALYQTHIVVSSYRDHYVVFQHLLLTSSSSSVPNTLTDSLDRPAGVLSGTVPPRLDSSAVNQHAMVESPRKGSLANKLPNGTGKSMSQPQTPVSDPNPPADIQSSMQAFFDMMVKTAVQQTRYESLNHDERQQRDEQARWSGYYDNFVSLSEDQTRILKATQSNKGQSEKQLNEVRQKGEQAAQRIAQYLTAASAGRPAATENDVVVERLESKLLSLGNEIESLKREISTLQKSAVEVKSNYHHVEEIANTQRLQEKEISELHENTLRHREWEAKYDKKISELAAQSKAFTAFTSKQDRINKDFSHFQEFQIAMRSKSNLELQEVKDGLIKNNSSHEATLVTLKRVEEDLITSKQDTALLQEFRTQIEKTANHLVDRLQHVSDSQSTEKSSLEQLEKRFTKEISQMTHHDHITSQKVQEMTGTYSTDHRQLLDELEALKVRLSSTEQMHNDEARTQVNVQSDEVQTVTRQFDELRERLDILRESEEHRDEAVTNEIEGFNNILIMEGKKLDDQDALLVTHRNRLNHQEDRIVQIDAEQFSTKASLKAIEEEMIALKNCIRPDDGGQNSFTHQLQSEILDLQRQFDSNMRKLSQPSPSPPACGMKEEIQPKIEALETRVVDLQNSRHGLTDKIRAVETFQATYESRWNNLTTESLVNGVLYHLQRPLHLLQNDINQVKQKQNQHDVRVVQLESRIDSIQQLRNNDTSMQDSQIQEIKKELASVNNAAMAIKPEVDEKLKSITVKFDTTMAANSEIKKQLDSILTKYKRETDEKLDRLLANHDATTTAKSEIDEKVQLAQGICNATIAARQEIVGKLKEFLTKYDAMAAANGKTDEKLDSSQMRPDTWDSAIQSLRGLVQDNRTDAIGNILGLQAECAKSDEKLDTFREEILAETRKLRQKVEALDAGNNLDSQCKVPVGHTEVGKLQKGSDSDVPIVRPGKRSQPQRLDSIKKKRKLNPYPTGSDDESYNERSTPKSARSRRKSHNPGSADEHAPVETGLNPKAPQTMKKIQLAGNLSQPQADQTSPRRGRPPRKTAPSD